MFVTSRAALHLIDQLVSHSGPAPRTTRPEEQLIITDDVKLEMLSRCSDSTDGFGPIGGHYARGVIYVCIASLRHRMCIEYILRNAM